MTAPSILTLSSLFPGSTLPQHGVFVKERLADFRERSGARIRVVSPVPWAPRIPPFTTSPKYRGFATAPRRETVAGFEVERPRYAMPPKLGVPLQGLLYFLGCRATVRRLHAEEPFDVIDAHYAYPDGYAAAWLRHRLRIPTVLTVRGTDVNLLPSLAMTRGAVKFALESADAIVAVSQALAECAVRAGAAESRVTVIRNGVDAERFSPRDRSAARARFGIPADARVLASVGHLVERKGHDLVLAAAARIAKRPFVLIAGGGPEQARLAAEVQRLGLAERALLLGPVAHEDLPDVYCAADLLVLASSREGAPNVVLEAMACGVPVVATAVHGTPEIVREPETGVLVREREVGAIAAAVERALGMRFDRAAIRAHAETMSWRATSERLIALFDGVIGAWRAERGARARGAGG